MLKALRRTHNEDGGFGNIASYSVRAYSVRPLSCREYPALKIVQGCVLFHHPTINSSVIWYTEGSRLDIYTLSRYTWYCCFAIPVHHGKAVHLTRYQVYICVNALQHIELRILSSPHVYVHGLYTLQEATRHP